VAKLLHILRRHAFALVSSLGFGKTCAGSKIAFELKMPHMIVICPVSVQSKWQDMQERYGVPLKHNLNYCGVRSMKGKQPKHGLLTLRDYTVAVSQPRGEVRRVEKTDFVITDAFKSLLAGGVLLIMDKMQHLKNVSLQFAACQALIKAITESCEAGGKSRVLMLSGSPIDKQEQAVTLFRSLNVMQHANLCKFNPGLRQMELRGISNIIEFCRGVDPVATDRILAAKRYWMSSESVMRPMCYTLFQEVVKPHFSSAMPPPVPGCNVLKINAFYRIDNEEDRRTMSVGLRALEHAVRYNHRTGDVDIGRGVEALRAMCVALIKIESAKVRTFARVVHKTLKSNPR
jgi:hypothetical protein